MLRYTERRTVKEVMAMACCKVYVSESTNSQALDAIASAAQALLLHTFTDHAYNRVGFTLAGSLEVPHAGGLPLHVALMEMVTRAIHQIDLRQHAGSHPRLGVVDHVCFHPLGTSTLPSVASLAKDLARDIGLGLTVPTYLYGAAHPDSRSLDSIRRDLGYFSSMRSGLWEGAITTQRLPVAPDFGPASPSPKTGVVIVGACPWIANYNVPILSDDLQLGSRIARRVSTRGGGLPAVQAMALLHGPNKMEIACNLTDCVLTPADLVQDEVTRLGEREGLIVEPGYFTGHSQDEITEMAHRKLFGGE